MTRKKKYIQYAEDILSGKIVTGHYIKLAAERFFRLMYDERYEFREDKVEQVCEFICQIRNFGFEPRSQKLWRERCIAILTRYARESDGSNHYYCRI